LKKIAFTILAFTLFTLTSSFSQSKSASPSENMLNFLSYAISKGTDTRLIIHITCSADVPVSFNWTVDQKKAFLKRMEEEKATGIESELLKYYGGSQYFILLSRIDLSHVLSEHELQLNGNFDEKTIVDASKLIGANILLLFTFNMSFDNTNYQIFQTDKLISIATSQILAADTLIELTDKSGKFISGRINNNPIIQGEKGTFFFIDN